MPGPPLYLLCFNRVRDYTTWRRVFDQQREAHQRAGLTLQNVWVDITSINAVSFLFAVADEKAARAFLADPANAEVGRRAGVVHGEYHFVTDVPPA